MAKALLTKTYLLEAILVLPMVHGIDLHSKGHHGARGKQCVDMTKSLSGIHVFPLKPLVGVCPSEETMTSTFCYVPLLSRYYPFLSYSSRQDTVCSWERADQLSGDLNRFL